VDKDPVVGPQPPEEKLFVGGHWLNGQEWYEISDKVDRGVMALVPQCDLELVEMAIAAARDAVPSLARLQPSARASFLRRWADVAEQQAAALTDLIHHEAAVPLLWAESEVQQALAELRRTADSIPPPDDGDASGKEPGRELSWEDPAGIVAILLPERHALYFAAQMMGAALASGCPIVVKPSLLAPLAVRKFIEIGGRLGWPAGSVNLLYGSNRDLGKKLASDPRIALTVIAGNAREREAIGAVRAGRPFATVAAGQGAAVIDPSANIANVVSQLLALRFRNPVIGAPTPYYIVAPQDQVTRLKEALAAGMASLQRDTLRDAECEVPWQISDANAQRAEDWFSSITQAGGILFYGGDRKGTYVEPAIVLAPAGRRPITPPPPDAPVFIIDAYENDVDSQLTRFPNLQQVYVFSGDIDTGMKLAKIVNVPRVDLFIADSGMAAGSPGIHDTEGVRHAIGQMKRHKWVEVHRAS